MTALPARGLVMPWSPALAEVVRGRLRWCVGPSPIVHASVCACVLDFEYMYSMVCIPACRKQAMLSAQGSQRSQSARMILRPGSGTDPRSHGRDVALCLSLGIPASILIPARRDVDDRRVSVSRLCLGHLVQVIWKSVMYAGGHHATLIQVCPREPPGEEE